MNKMLRRPACLVYLHSRLPEHTLPVNIFCNTRFFQKARQTHCSRGACLCSPGPMFPSLYETGEHRTLFKKKGPMLPGLLLFPPLLPNSGRDNYHCMSLPFVEEGETSVNLTQSIHTPVNKPLEAQSLRELPVLRPSGGAQSFWP